MSEEDRPDPVFDEDIYVKAKPLFVMVFSDLSNLDLREAIAAVVRMVGDRSGVNAVQNMKPYLVRFLTEVRDGAVILDGPGADDAGGEGYWRNRRGQS